jgi:metal-dependent amidase/aminoacylase/carboxypeptidase family protein
MIDSTRSDATLYVTGSMRTFDPRTRVDARKRFVALVARNIKDGRADFIDEAPSVDNDPCLVRQATPILEHVYGAGKVKAMEPFTYSDDFGFMTRKVPAAIYLQLGTVNRAKGIVADSHTATYDVDEDILVSGALALQELATQAPAQYALSAAKGGCGR